MQAHPPRYRYMTEDERLEAEENGWVDPRPEPITPVRQKKVSKRSTQLADSEPVFDVRHWRLPSRWRNDKNVGDVAMGKMLRGIDLDRYERMSAC